jgi:hypothetical protein
VRRERAGRRVRAVEVEHHLAAARRIRVEEPAAPVRRLARRLVAKDEEQLRLARFQHGVSRSAARGEAPIVNDAIPGLGISSTIPSTLGTLIETGFAFGVNVATTRIARIDREILQALELARAGLFMSLSRRPAGRRDR